MAVRSKFLLLLGLAVVYYLNPLYVRSTAFSFARTIHGYVDLTPVEDPDSLQAAVANVTSDINQLTAILDDFFQRQPDDAAETSFKEFLRRKATSTKHRDLEYYLDWILGFYKFAWPFVLVYALMRLSSAKGKIDEIDKPLKKEKRIEGSLKSRPKSGGSENQDTGLNAIIRDGNTVEPKRLHRRIGSAQSFH